MKKHPNTKSLSSRKPHGKAGKQHRGTPDNPSLCPVSQRCGACTSIDVPYAQQLVDKQTYITDLFSGELFGECMLEPIAGMDDPFHFRNKIVSPFAPGERIPGKMGRDGKPRHKILTGMYAAGTHRLVDTSCCKVEHPVGQQIVTAVKHLMSSYSITPYNEDTGAGFMRHVIVRVGHASNEVLVTLVTNGEEFPGSRNFCRELIKKVPAITTVVQNVNTRNTNVILGEQERTLFGPGFILDTLCGLSFRISSKSFYQVNAVQTEVLYTHAVDLARIEQVDNPIIVDAYCGTGTIGLVAAKRVADATVIGVDSVESAIADARGNATHNGINNATFVAADASEYVRTMAEQGEHAHVVLMDPPRAGSTPEFLDAVARLAPERIVYISCNPETQLRDVQHIARHGYMPRVIQAVDMFPHTDHVECVVLLEKNN